MSLIKKVFGLIKYIRSIEVSPGDLSSMSIDQILQFGEAEVQKIDEEKFKQLIADPDFAIKRIEEFRADRFKKIKFRLKEHFASFIPNPANYECFREYAEKRKKLNHELKEMSQYSNQKHYWDLAKESAAYDKISAFINLALRYYTFSGFFDRQYSYGYTRKRRLVEYDLDYVLHNFNIGNCPFFRDMPENLSNYENNRRYWIGKNEISKISREEDHIELDTLSHIVKNLLNPKELFKNIIHDGFRSFEEGLVCIDDLPYTPEELLEEKGFNKLKDDYAAISIMYYNSGQFIKDIEEQYLLKFQKIIERIKDAKAEFSQMESAYQKVPETETELGIVGYQDSDKLRTDAIRGVSDLLETKLEIISMQIKEKIEGIRSYANSIAQIRINELKQYCTTGKRRDELHEKVIAASENNLKLINRVFGYLKLI